MKTILIAILLTLVMGTGIAAERKTSHKEASPRLELRTYAQMLSVGEIRIAVPDDASLYYPVDGRYGGFAPEIAHALEIWINQKFVFRKKQKVLRVVLVRSGRDELYRKLRTGEADLVFANLGGIADTNQFKGLRVQPSWKPPHEVLVSGRQVIDLTRADDLSGQTILTGRPTNIEKSLESINAALKSEGKPSIEIKRVSSLSMAADEELLKMLDIGSASFAIVSEWKASLWQSVYRNIQIRSTLSAPDPDWLGWAARRNAADLLKDIATFETSGYDAMAKQGFRLSHQKLVNSK